MADNLADDRIRQALAAARQPSNIVTEADVYEPSIGEKLASIPQSLYEIGAGLPGAISRYASAVPERASAAASAVSQMSPSELAGAVGSSAKRMFVDPLMQAGTLAGRYSRGEVAPENVIPEVLNFSSVVALGGMPASALERSPGVMLGTSGSKTVPDLAADVAKRDLAKQDAAQTKPAAKTVEPAVQVAEQANKDLAPEAIAKTVAVEPTVTAPKDMHHAQITEVGHQIGTERGERRTIKEQNIRLTPEEKEIVNSFESPAEKAKIAGAIRATKARYPVSDGWAPLQLVDAKLNDKGLPELQWQQPAYGFNRAMTNVERPVTDATGQKVMEPKKDAAGNILLDDFGNPILSNKPVKIQTVEERSMKRGTPEYDKAINKAVKNSFSEIEDVVRRAAEGDEGARVILRQVGWYREFMRKGFDERGGAYPAFSDILGATSPNTAVDQNYRYAVEAQQRFARGDFDPQVAFAANYQGSLNKFPEEQLIRREVVDPKTGEFKQYGMNSRNAQMAMADLWRQQEEGQAPKARNFSGNLGGATDAATIDVWAARHVQRMLGRKRLPPPAEGGVKGKMMMSAPDNPVGPYGPMPMTLKAGGEFGFGQDMYSKLADRVNQSKILTPYLNQLGYSNITPMDLQALTWFIEKEHWTKNNWTTKAGEGGSFEDEMSKFPSNRWQSGFSISQGDTPPTNEMMEQARNVVEGSVKNDDDVMVYRVHPTYGRYGGYDERSFDVELTAKPDWNPTNWMASIISEAQKNNQYDVFFSKRLDPSQAQVNPNARPGVEIYFQNRKDMQEILPILDEFTSRGMDGFTFTTDLRLRERQSGGADTPDYVGVRLQYIPEIRMRFDEDFRNAVVNDPQVLQDDLKSALNNMQNAINALDKSGAKIVDARVHHYDTLTVGKESYDDFLRGIADLENSSSEYERGARGTNPLARFGQPISSHVNGRNRALRAGLGEGSADASAAVEQPNLSVDDILKSRGGSAFAGGGRAMGNNAIDNALRAARDHFADGGWESQGRGSTVTSARPQGSSGRTDFESYSGYRGSGSEFMGDRGGGRDTPVKAPEPMEERGVNLGREFGPGLMSGLATRLRGDYQTNLANLEGLDPQFQPKAESLLDRMKAAGMDPYITSAARTPSLQASMRERYLKEGGPYPVAAPGTSFHNYGLAFDVGGLSNQQLAEAGRIAEEMGMGWGGRFKDPIHFQMAPAGQSAKEYAASIGAPAVMTSGRPFMEGQPRNVLEAALQTARNVVAAPQNVVKNIQQNISQANAKEAERLIAAGAPAVAATGYNPNVTAGISKQQYADQFAGGDVSKVKERIVNYDGRPQVDYYVKDLGDVLGGMFGSQVATPATTKATTTPTAQSDANAIYAAKLIAQGEQSPWFKETGYNPNISAGVSKQQYANDFAGGDVSKVKERIVYYDGQPKVDYYVKSLPEAIFGGLLGNQAAPQRVEAAPAFKPMPTQSVPRPVPIVGTDLPPPLPDPLFRSRESLPISPTSEESAYDPWAAYMAQYWGMTP